MSTTAEASRPAPPAAESDVSRPITSVNAGPRAALPWKFWVLGSVAILAVGGGTFYAISKLRLRDAILPAGMTVQRKPVGTPIDPTGSFAARPLGGPLDAIPLASTPTVSVAGAGTAAMPIGNPRAEPCMDRPVRDAQGKPIMGSDGLPLLVTCDGRSVPTRTTPTVSIAGVPPMATPGGLVPSNTAPMATSDRFGGGVIIEAPAKAPVPGELPAETKEALDVLKRVETGQLGAPAHPSSPSGTANGGLRLVGFSDQAPGGGRPASAPRPAAGGDGRETERYTATTLDKRRWIALRGTQVECNLTLAYVSEVAGEAHCVIARDVYGQDGSAIIIDRGSVANGSFRAVNGLGERRAQVIWDRLVTPAGVVVTLASKGTDALGSTGIPAEVDNRWFDRLGVALAISLVKDVSTAVATRYAQAASAPSQQILSSSQRFADEVLSQTIAIRPALYVKQGSAASIVLQGDLDFSGVYALRR